MSMYAVYFLLGIVVGLTAMVFVIEFFGEV